MLNSGKPMERDEMLGALEDTTTAVIAHGLLNSMAVLQGTASAMIEHWDQVAADPAKALQMLERIQRHARLASGVLEDLVRGLPPEMASTFSTIDRR
jgi:hypothetical protein